MSVKEIYNDNATTGNVYTIHMTQKNAIQQQQARGIDKYANVTCTIQTTR